MSIDYPNKNKRQANKDIDKSQINSNFSPWKLLFILSSISIMVMYVETMLLPAIPDIISEFNITYSMSSWIFASFIISALISTTIVSKLSDIYGRKKILLIVLTIYIIGVIGGGLSNNICYVNDISDNSGYWNVCISHCFCHNPNSISKR